MSSGWLHRSSRFVAALLLLVSAAGLPHRSKLDDNCLNVVVEQHDESKHVFKAETSAAHPDHCAICHWTRWLKPAFSARPIVAPVETAGAELAASASLLPRNASTEHLPSRAPPAAASSSHTRHGRLS